MDLGEFGKSLDSLAPGQAASLPYGTYQEFFPPGAPDPTAAAAARLFGRKHGCKVEDPPNSRDVVFTKKTPP
jgi:hypothetical protein